MVRIAFPNKGRLSEETTALFAEAGLALRGRSERSLTARIDDDYEAIFVRAQDIPELVADGAADVGVTGKDLVEESGRALVELLDLELGRCRLVVAAREDDREVSLEALPPGARVATSFPRIARGFFEARRLPVEIVPLSGAVEIAPHLGIAELVVDLVSTGSTLRVNGLREIGTILGSSARLVARPGERATSAAVRDLVVALSSVLRARGQRYLMANVPRQALGDVTACLPGLNGPTVSEIVEGGPFVALHAVVPEPQVFRTVAKLKGLGCEGILVTRIERLVP